MDNVDKIKRGEPVRDPDRIVSHEAGSMADAALTTGRRLRSRARAPGRGLCTALSG